MPVLSTSPGRASWRGVGRWKHPSRYVNRALPSIATVCAKMAPAPLATSAIGTSSSESYCAVPRLQFQPLWGGSCTGHGARLRAEML